jgi:hypothetical protein
MELVSPLNVLFDELAAGCTSIDTLQNAKPAELCNGKCLWKDHRC